MGTLPIGKIVLLMTYSFYVQSLDITNELESMKGNIWYLDDVCQWAQFTNNDLKDPVMTSLKSETDGTASVANHRYSHKRVKEKRLKFRTFFDDGSDSFFYTIKGTWVSEGCESRPGPSFVMRRYTIRSSRKFVSRQYHYKDISCSIPYYVISTEGRLSNTRSSWLIPGSFEADEPIVTKVTIIPYSRRSANSLTRRIGAFCNETVNSKNRNIIKRFQFFDVSSVEESYSKRNTSDSTYEDVNYKEAQIECVLRALNWTSSEFQLWRYVVLDGQQYLSLGASQSSSSMSVHTRPTYFHQPLLKSGSCSVCKLVAKSKLIRPPLLRPKYIHPLSIAGVWSSRRCEIHSEAVFLNRRIQFKEGTNGTGTWISKYSYFKDPNCKGIVFDLFLSGSFVIGEESTTLHGATNIDITTRKALITPKDQGFLENLKNADCTNKALKKPLWGLNQTVDLTPFGGCQALNVLIPRTYYDISRTEIKSNGATFLYFGLMDDSDETEYSPSKRPTSLRYPLEGCHVIQDTRDFSLNQLHPLSQAFTYYKSEGYNALAYENYFLEFVLIIGWRLLK